jgi:hypothetical protein
MFPFFSAFTAFFPLLALSMVSLYIAQSHRELYRSHVYFLHIQRFSKYAFCYRYITTALRSQYFLQGKAKSRLSLRNAYCH